MSGRYGLGQAAADAVAMADWVDRVEGVLSSFRYADWAGAYERAGIRGLLVEFLRTLVGSNRYRIQFRRFAGFNGGQVERMLRHYGVRLWGRGFTPGPEGTLYFYVKRSQADWADYLLRRWGVPVVSPPPDPRNPQYVARHEVGSLPPAWADGGEPSPFERLPDSHPRAREASERQRRADKEMFDFLDQLTDPDWQEWMLNWLD